MLASSLTRCCIVKLSCGLGGRMNFGRVIVVVYLGGHSNRVELGDHYAYGFPYEMVCI